MIDIQSGSLNNKSLFRNEPQAQVKAGTGAQYRPPTQLFSCVATESAMIPIIITVVIVIICTWGSVTPLSTMHRVTSLILQDMTTLYHMNQLFMVMESMG